MEDLGEKKLAQKSCKGQKGPQMAKLKKWIHTEKAEASRAKNLSSQSETFLTIDARRALSKLR